MSVDAAPATLVSLPARSGDRRAAALVGIGLIVAMLAVAPFAGHAWAPFPGFVLTYQAALVVVDVITAVFLLAQLRIANTRDILALAVGFLLVAVLTIAHGLSFPGAYTPTGLLGDGPQITPWLYMAWHATLPLAVIAYARLEPPPAAAAAPLRRATAAWIAAATILTGVVIVALVVGNADDLPDIIDEGRYVKPGRVAGLAVLALTVAAMMSLAKRQRQTILDPWLTLVMVAWACEMTLGSVLNQTRFDVGFYVGRTFGLFAAFVTMAVLLVEQSRLLADAVLAHREVRAAAAVRESRDVLALAMRAGRMGAWSRDLATDRVWWSRELEELFGLPAGGFDGAGQAFREMVHPEHRLSLARAVEQAIAARNDYIVEFRFRHASGDWRWMEGRGRAVYDDAGKPVMLYGFGMDIDDRKRAEAALVESETRLRTLADNMAQLAWMSDADGHLFWLNERWTAYTGMTVEETAAGGWRGVQHPQHVDRVLAKLRTAMHAGEAWEDVFPLRGKSGDYRWFLSRAVPIRDGAGQVYRWFGTATDVTMQREAEEALREIDRRKDEFLAILAHELRNPLAPLRNAVEILRQPGLAPAQAEWARDVMTRQISHMTRLIDDLIDVSRVTRGTIELKRERTDVQSIVQRALETSLPLIDAGGLVLDVDLPEQPLAVDGDPARLTQAIANLLNNAARYTPRGGHVAVAATRDDAEVRITVSDDGIGIAPELLTRIFDMFTQGSQSRGQGGLGIGLTLARSIVEMHGGTLEASSEGSSQGSTFTITLPGAPAGAAAAVPRPAAAEPPHATPRRVLVVDDNVDAAQSLAVLLRHMGHDVRVAHEGETALGDARAFLPDVVFLDIALPGMSGYDVARALRATSATPAARIVALTGYSQQDDVRRSHEAGFDAHLVKPVEADALARALAESAARHR
jgi:PAS domain S-box-containing protein